MRRVKAGEGANGTPTPTTRAPPAAPRRATARKVAAIRGGEEDAAGSSGSSTGTRSRQTSSEDDLVKRMEKTKIGGGIRSGLGRGVKGDGVQAAAPGTTGPPAAPSRNPTMTSTTTRTARTDTDGSPTTSVPLKLTLTQSAAPPPGGRRSKPTASTSTTSKVTTNEVPETPLTPAQQAHQVKSSINIVLRSLTSAITSGFRRDTSAMAAGTKTLKSTSTPVSRSRSTPTTIATKTESQSATKENEEWTNISVEKLIRDGLDGFTALEGLPEMKERSKLKELEKTRAGFVGKCLAVGYFELALDSLLEARPNILTFYPSAPVVPLPQTSRIPESVSTTSTATSKISASTKTPSRTTRTPKSSSASRAQATPAAILPPTQIRSDWLQLCSLPDVEVKILEQIEEVTRTVLFSNLAYSLIAVSSLLGMEEDAKILSNLLQTPDPSSTSAIHLVTVGKTLPGDPTGTFMYHSIHAMIKLEKRISSLYTDRSFQRTKLAIYVSYGSVCSKITSGQVWEALENAASRFFNRRDVGVEEEEAGMRQAAALLEEVMEWVERGVSKAPIVLDRKGKEWSRLLDLWLDLGRHLVELSIINRVTGLRQKTEGDDPANMSAALERLAIDSKDAADQLKEACGSLVKLTVTIDRIQALDDAEQITLTTRLKDHQTISDFFAALSSFSKEDLTNVSKQAVSTLDRSRRRINTLLTKQSSCSAAIRHAARNWESAMVREVDTYLSRIDKIDLVDNTHALDLAADAIDTLIYVAREDLVVSDEQTHLKAKQSLEAALLIRDRCELAAAECADWTLCIATTSYSIGVILWKASMFPTGINFFSWAAELSGTALELHRATDPGMKQWDQKWQDAQASVVKRWDVVASGHTKMHAKAAAAKAHLFSVLSHDPLMADKVVQQAKTMSPIKAFDSQPQIQASITRMTAFIQLDGFVINHCLQELWDAAKNSKADSEYWPLVFEALACNLEGCSHRDGVADVIESISSKLLDVYTAKEHPYRRLRTLVRLLRLGASTSLANHDAASLQQEATSLSKQEAVGQDAGLLRYKILSEANLLMSKTTHAYHHQSSRDPQAYSGDLCRVRDLLKSILHDSAENSTRNADSTQDIGDLPYELEAFIGVVRVVGDAIINLDFLRLLRQVQRLRPELFSKYITTSCQLALEFAALGKLSKANRIFTQTKAAATRSHVSEGQQAHLHLSYALFLAMAGDINESTGAYASALDIAQTLEETKQTGSAAKIRQRVEFLERAALAHLTAAEIAVNRDDASAVLSHRSSAFKLLNKALDSLSRLAPSSKASSTPPIQNDPFIATPAAQSGPDGVSADESAAKREGQWRDMQRRQLPGEHLRISDALLSSMLLLARDYLDRGSAKQAESMLRQAQGLAEAIRSDIWKARSACLLGDIYSTQHRFKDASAQIESALSVLSGLAGGDSLEISRVKAMLQVRTDNDSDAQETFTAIIRLLEDCETSLGLSDKIVGTPARGVKKSPIKVASASVFNSDGLPRGGTRALSRHARLLYDMGQEEESKAILARLQDAAITKTDDALYQHTSGTLSVMQAFSRFKNDLFMNSLTESTLSMPIGSLGPVRESDASRQETVRLLEHAEEAFTSYLASTGRQGEVSKVREASVMSALLMCYQTSLGKSSNRYMKEALTLLDSAAAITLNREMIDNADEKVRDKRKDDMIWPLLAQSDRVVSPANSSSSIEISDYDTAGSSTYWAEVASRHRKVSGNIYDSSELNRLPPNWSIVNINVTDDEKTIFVSKHQSGQKPILFCLPIDRQGKREEEEEDAPTLTFEDAITELRSIISASDTSAKSAKDTVTKEGKAEWWTTRMALDTRLADLLSSIEFCWLGAFKTIFQPVANFAESDLAAFRSAIQRSFSRALSSGSPGTSKIINRIELDEDIARCFAALSPQSKPEELDDLVYYLLDLYQFQGVPVAQAEIDTDQLGIELQAALQMLHAQGQWQTSTSHEEHTFLILDRKVQQIPWESIPILRGRSISRIPSISFLFDRLPSAGDLSDYKKTVSIDGAYYIVNPSGDLKTTEKTFEGWLKEMKDLYGWKGMVGTAPSEMEMKNALRNNDLVLYMGHGGAEAYIRSQDIRNSRTCATTMLWGCSSGMLEDGGDLDPTGTPYNYMIGGCPSLIANLWDVTDKDIDKMSFSVFEQVGLMPNEDKYPLGKKTNAQALNAAREGCKLKYLTGAAPVVMGIPVYFGR